MSYQVVGEQGKNPNFQNRCWGAVMAMVSLVLGSVENSGSVLGAGGVDITTADSKAQARKFAKLTHLSTDRTIANLVLLNATIAGDPSGSTDSDLQYQVGQVWPILMDIG
jgi:hypothetical protein